MDWRMTSSRVWLRWVMGSVLTAALVSACGSKDNKVSSKPQYPGSGGTDGGSDGGSSKPDNGGASASPDGGEGGTEGGSPSAAGNGSGPGGSGTAGDGSQLGGPDAGAGGGGAIASCIAGIYDVYVLRADGIALFEPSANNEHVILEATTALPLTGISGLQGGSSHGCAALANGSAACWQVATDGNGAGQLGNGTTAPSAVLYRSTPVLTAASTPLANVVAMAAGGESNIPVNTSCAVTSDGKLWCWGDLSWIVKKGIPLASPYAQAITMDGLTALTGVIQAAFTTTGACAVVRGTPNSLWCWGNNASNELAQGDTVTRQYPTKVLALTAPTKVVMTNANADRNTICALDGNSVRCWGHNAFGTVGINNTTSPIPNPTPVVIQNGTTVLSGVSDIEPGFAAFTALRTDGSLWDWGYGFEKYAGNYGLTNILAIAYASGFGGNGPRFLTSDGVYHNGLAAVPVECGAFQ
jgi:Regulator of chromosome condensation (RCC1) repeat